MVYGLLALVLAGAADPAPTVASLGDVVALVERGVPEDEVVAGIARAGVYLPLNAETAVKLYLDGVPAAVLAAVFRSSGNSFPKVSSERGEIELLYDGYRIVGRRAASGGPSLALSGYDRAGERLKPPVQAAPPSPEDRERAETPPARAAREPEVRALPPARRAEPPPEPAPATPQLSANFGYATDPVVVFVPFLLDPSGGSPPPEPPTPLKPVAESPWSTYASLAWPGFNPRKAWDFPAPTAAASPPAASPAAPSPLVVRDRIAR